MVSLPQLQVDPLLVTVTPFSIRSYSRLLMFGSKAQTCEG